VTNKEPCWGFHASAIPSEATEVETTEGVRWERAGPRSWRPPGWQTSCDAAMAAADTEPAARFHEAWLLETHGPVRCMTAEHMLAEREDKLLAMLAEPPEGERFPGAVVMPVTGDLLVIEDALMLMSAGWLIWTPKQRREALASVAEAREVEMTP